ncbi:MAG: acyl-CoA dehydrogenase, partial [Desulfuromusa sp.]|nr:acyl-CoA dehydrogenase [Desulfuromusa sp.]
QEQLKAAVKVFTFGATEVAASAARKGAYFVEEGDTLAMILSGVRRFTKYDATGLLQAKRTLAAAASETEKYIF